MKEQTISHSAVQGKFHLSLKYIQTRMQCGFIYTMCLHWLKCVFQEHGIKGIEENNCR